MAGIRPGLCPGWPGPKRADTSGPRSMGLRAAVGGDVHTHRSGDGAEVAQADSRARVRTGAGEDGEEQRGKRADDGERGEKLTEREPLILSTPWQSPAPFPATGFTCPFSAGTRHSAHLAGHAIVPRGAALPRGFARPSDSGWRRVPGGTGAGPWGRKRELPRHGRSHVGRGRDAMWRWSLASSARHGTCWRRGCAEGATPL